MKYSFHGNWITNSYFANLKKYNVFHKQLDKIEYPCDFINNQHILFRKTFSLKKFFSAFIYISADDYYKLYINGNLVTFGPAPCYDFNYYVNKVDITSFLHEGKNLIAVHTYYQGVPNRVYVSGDLQHGLALDLYVDENLVLYSDESFKVCNHSGYSSNYINHHRTQFIEEYNCNAKEALFYDINFDDSYWKNACGRKYQNYQTFIQTTKNNVFYEIKPNVILNKDNLVFIDIGQEIVGYPNIRIRGEKDSIVLIRYAEELNDDGSLRYDLRSENHYEEKLLLSGLEDFFDVWDYKGFRYLEIVLPKGATLIHCGIIVRHYPFNQVRYYDGKDEAIKKVFDLCSNTIKYGVQEAYIDCPTREKGQYFSDGFYIAISHYVLTNDLSMFRKMIENAFQTSFIDRGLMAAGPNAYMQEIAEYPFLIVIASYVFFALSNDYMFLQYCFKECKKLLKHIKKRYSRKDDLICIDDKWNVVDWPANCRDDYDCDLTQKEPCIEFHNVINAYYIEAIKCFNVMAKLLNKKENKIYSKVVSSYQKCFFDEEKGLYKDREKSNHCSIASNVCPLFIGIVKDELVKKNIFDLIKEKKLDFSNCFISQVILLSLYKYNENDFLSELIKDKNAWLNMIKEGATTTFEAFSKAKKEKISLFHPVFAYPVIFLTDFDLKKIFIEV